MFGKKKKLRGDLPAIDIRKKPKKGLLGRIKWVPISKREQRKLKKQLMKQYPDRYFVDDLHEWNSVDPLEWIDKIEEINAILDDEY